MTIKALTFDTGGTILDWHRGISGAFAAAGAARGLQADWAAVTFHLAFWTGIVLGILQAANLIPASWAIGTGKYAILLGANLYGLALCTAGFFLPLSLPRYRVSASGNAA